MATVVAGNAGGSELPTSDGTASKPAPPPSADEILAAALSGKPIATVPSVSSVSATVSAPARPVANASSRDGAAGLDWLSAAAIPESQLNGSAALAKTPLPASSPQSPGWLTSGKLGISTEDDTGEDADGTQTGLVTDTKKTPATRNKTRKGKSNRGALDASVGSTAAPGGWLALGIASVKLEASDDGDSDNNGELDGDGPKMTTSSTQWEEGDGESKARTTAVTKLPPWAKQWTPTVPDPPAVEADDKSASTSDAKPSAGGLDWINGAMSGAPTGSTPAGVALGTSWLPCY